MAGALRRPGAIIGALALGYRPRGQFRIPGSFLEGTTALVPVAMYVDAGAAAITADPIGFAREQWDTWSPTDWYRKDDFAATAHSFRNPDWGGDHPQRLPNAIPRHRTPWTPGTTICGGAGHFPHREASEAVLREVIPHLTAHS